MLEFEFHKILIFLLFLAVYVYSYVHGSLAHVELFSYM
jgi:hypothetical protein